MVSFQKVELEHMVVPFMWRTKDDIQRQLDNLQENGINIELLDEVHTPCPYKKMMNEGVKSFGEFA